MPYGYRRGGSAYGNYDRYMLDYWEVRRGYAPEGDYGRSAGDYGDEPRRSDEFRRRDEPRGGRERDIPHLTGSGQEAWDRERDEQDYRDYGFTHGYWPKDYHEGQGYSRGYRIGHGREDYEGPGHRGRGPRGYARPDERIREDVSDRLMDDPYLDASDIEVRVSGREVTLDGTVESRRDKRRAEDIAESVAGVAYVQNNLRVRRREQGWP